MRLKGGLFIKAISRKGAKAQRCQVFSMRLSDLAALREIKNATLFEIIFLK